MLAARTDVPLRTAAEADRADAGAGSGMEDAVERADAAQPLNAAAGGAPDVAGQSSGMEDARLRFRLPAPDSGAQQHTRRTGIAAEANADMQRSEGDERRASDLAGLAANFAAQLLGERLGWFRAPAQCLESEHVSAAASVYVQRLLSIRSQPAGASRRDPRPARVDPETGVLLHTPAPFH